MVIFTQSMQQFSEFIYYSKKSSDLIKHFCTTHPTGKATCAPNPVM